MKAKEKPAQIDRSLINTLKRMTREEKQVSGYKRRVRVKGRLITKGMTKKGNIRLTVQRGEDSFCFIVVSTHRDNYALAETLEVGSAVAAAGIRKLRAIICTQLKKIEQVDSSRQTTLRDC